MSPTPPLPPSTRKIFLKAIFEPFEMVPKISVFFGSNGVDLKEFYCIRTTFLVFVLLADARTRCLTFISFIERNCFKMFDFSRGIQSSVTLMVIIIKDRSSFSHPAAN